MPTTPLTPSNSALELVSRALLARLNSRVGRLLVTGVMATGLYFLWNWVNTESVAELNAGDTSSPLQVQGLKSFLVRENGQKHWEIAADSVRVVDGGDAWLARGVSKGVLFRDDQTWITMSAPRVRLSNLSKNLDAVGGVQAQGPEGFSFVTPQARWLNQKQLVEIPGPVQAKLRGMDFFTPNLSYQWEKGDLNCPDKVEVRAPGAIMRGSKLQANINRREIQLGGGVELIFDPSVAKLPPPP